MNEEKTRVLGVLGLAFALVGYANNEIVMRIYMDSIFYDIPGTLPHSGPQVIGTAWLLLIQFGVMLVLVSIASEIIYRFYSKETTEIYE